MKKAKIIYICLMALFYITSFAQGSGEYSGTGGGYPSMAYNSGPGSGNNSGFSGYSGNNTGSSNANTGCSNCASNMGGMLNTVVVNKPTIMTPKLYNAPTFTPPIGYNLNFTGAIYNYYNYGSYPVGTVSNNNNNTTPNGWGKAVVTLKELLALIAELKATSIRRYYYGYVDSQGKTHIGEMYEIENPNAPAQHMFYFDEIGGTSDLWRMTERPTGREFPSNSGSSASPPFSVTPWKGNNPQNTSNPNSVWVQDPNDGKWLFITPGGQTTTVGAPPVTAVPPATDPCAEIKRQLLNAKYKEMIAKLDNTTTLHLPNETGFWQDKDGNFFPMELDGSSHLKLPTDKSTLLNVNHVHQEPWSEVIDGVSTFNEVYLMPSRQDIWEVYYMNLNAQYNNLPTNNVYVGTTSSLGNYQLRFTGEMSNLSYVKLMQDTLLDEANSDVYKSAMRDNGDEAGLLCFLRDKMGKTDIALYKVDATGGAKIELNNNNIAVKKPCNP
jgi:hypothetical protein